MRWWPVAAILIAGCRIEAALVECPGGLLCPVGSVCDTIHDACIEPEQAESCVGVADSEHCTAGDINGYCLDQICINPGCGNHVVDADELCDDGNRTSGDGCGATCKSREICGDGVVNSELAEECDDGNLISRDGCDSRCLHETAVWTADGLGPRSSVADWMIWDPVRQHVVMLTDGVVWGWTGTQWTVDGIAPAISTTYDVTFDTDRNRLVVIAAEPPTSDVLDPSPPRTLLYEWDGSTWTTSMLTNAPRFDEQAFLVVYDPVRKRVFGFGLTDRVPAAATLDLVTHAWATASVPTGATLNVDLGFGLAFDEGRGRVVLVSAELDGYTNPAVHEWNGTAWTSTAAAMQAKRGWSLIYNPATQRVIAVGTESYLTGVSPVQAWNGTAWSNLPSVPSTRVRPGVGFDRVRNAVVVFGGEYKSNGDDVYEWHGTAWSEAARLSPSASVFEACAFDDFTERYVCIGPSLSGVTRETWAWHNGTWSKLAATLADEPGTMAYDPTRKKLVAWPSTGGVVLDGDTWTALPINNVDNGFEGKGMVFDPIGARLVISTTSVSGTGPHTSILMPDNAFHRFPSNTFTSMAFDARNNNVIGSNGAGSEVLVDDVWTPAVAPGNGSVVYTNARRGTVEFFAPGLRVVERVGASFNELPELPPYAISGYPAMNQRTGELHVLGFKGLSRFMLHRGWQSATPLESCVAGDDADGDGLAGCDDKDCWYTCTPLCPPDAVCP